MVKEYMHTVHVLRETKGSRPDFTVLVGLEDQILPALLAGADGAICVLSNIAPEPFVGLARDFEGDDLAKATELHRSILPLMAIYASSKPGLGAALPAPPNSREPIEATLEAVELLTVQGEA
jgi:4-hydroxy-tetrahydrodipicolinate synthase